MSGYVVRKSGHRAWPVTFTLIECDDAGNVTEAESGFVAHFRRFTEAEYEGIVKRAVGEDARAPEDMQMPEILARNARIFGELMTGWSAVAGEDGAALPYSAEALAGLVTGPDGQAVSAGIHQAIAQIRFGIAPRKNSNASPAPGPAPGAGEA